MKCSTHPTYQVQRRPTSGCRVCMALWRKKFPVRAREYARLLRKRAAQRQRYITPKWESNENVYYDGWYKD